MAAIKDVAKMAGVSVAAVSKYLKTPQNMRKETRDKIAAAISALNYRPNPLAQSLRTGKTNIIAIAIPELDNPYFNKIFNILQALCEERGFLAILLKNANIEHSKSTASILKSGLVDGVICYDEGHADELIADGEAIVPFVKFGPIIHNDYSAAVGIDLQTGIKKLCHHLEQIGSCRIGYIGPDQDISSVQKIQAIQEYCENSNLYLDPHAYLTDCNSYISGYNCCKKLLASGFPLPDAIIVESDMIAMGVLKGLCESGLQVPEDIMLSGFDNTDISQMSNPSLTTISIPTEEICTAALDMLCEIMNGNPVAPVVFQTDLVVRTSTMPAR